jgi:hypothetical protein
LATSSAPRWAADILPGPACPTRLTIKEAAPAPVSQGLFLDGYRRIVFNPARVMQDFKINKKNMTDTTIHPRET